MRVSIGIAAYNEGNTISQVINSIYTQLTMSCEVIVVADGCTDDTIRVVRKLQGRYQNLRLVIENIRKGKPSALNTIKTIATGQVLVLTDADVIWRNHALSMLLPNFSDPRVGAVCARVVPLNSSTTLLSKLAHIACFIWHKVRMQQSFEGRLFSPSGNLYAVRRELFPYIPHAILNDDAYVGLQLTRNGFLVKYEPQAVVYGQFPTTLHEFCRQKIRTRLGRLQLRSYGWADEIHGLESEYIVESIKMMKSAVGLDKFATALHILAELTLRLAARVKACWTCYDKEVLWTPMVSTKNLQQPSSS